MLTSFSLNTVNSYWARGRRD